jgi:hypothetical protein
MRDFPVLFARVSRDDPVETGFLAPGMSRETRVWNIGR